MLLSGALLSLESQVAGESLRLLNQALPNPVVGGIEQSEDTNPEWMPHIDLCNEASIHSPTPQTPASPNQPVGKREGDAPGRLGFSPRKDGYDSSPAVLFCDAG